MPEEILTLRIHFPDGDAGGIDCVEVEPGLYRLQQSVLLVDPPLYLGEIVQLTPRPGGDFDFVRRAARSRLRHSCFMLTREQSSGPEHTTFLERVTAAGGHWEIWFGGILLLHLPRESEFDVHAEWSRVFGTAPTES